MADKEYKLKRKMLKTKLTRISNNINNENDIIALQEYLEQLKNMPKEFDEIQMQISLLSNEDDNDTQLNEFETKHFKTTCEIKRKLKETSSSNTYVNNEQTNNIRQQTVNLPAINLPNFSGNYKEWLPFRDLFKSLIHDKTELVNIQKFHYLKSCLAGDALKTIESIALTGETYDTAWDLLRARYEKPRFIIESHIKSFLNVQNISKYSLRGVLDEITKTVRALASLGQNPTAGDTLLIQLYISKLEKSLKMEWQEHSIDLNLPTLTDFLDFLTKKCNVFESIQVENNFERLNIANKTPGQKRQTLLQTNKINCSICNNLHFIYQCNTFLSMSINERIKVVKDLKFCLNCLKQGHYANDCRATKCKKCGKSHNTLLHIEVKTNANQTDNNTNATCLHNCNNSVVLLSTALIEIKTKNNKWVKAKAILDTGSQANFVTNNLANRLQLNKRDINLSIMGVNNKQNFIKNYVTTEFKSLHNNFQSALDFLVIPEITQKTPSQLLNKNKIEIPRNVKLADPTFHRPSNVDILIGAEIFYNLLSIGQIQTSEGYTFQKTKLGWLVSGRYSNDPQQTYQICNLVTKVDDISINRLIPKFWEIDNSQQINYLNKDDQFCERNFIETYKRDESGRFIVQLPFKSKPILGDSKNMAIKRFKALEGKLNKNLELKQEYYDFMKTYIELGHMKLATNKESLSNIDYYLPHHGVINEHSTTTRLRVVFDGSAKSTNGKSLNDFLLPGPKLQHDLVDILIRFRTYKYVLAADISKMFRQVQLSDELKSLHKILFRFNNSDQINVYELQTVTYGTTSASYIAIKCIQQLASLEKDNLPIGSKTILNDFYVDDMLTGANSIQDINEIKQQTTTLLKKGGFELHKWQSNYQKILGNTSNQSQNNLLNIDKESTQKTLGIQWNYVTDVLQYSTPTFTANKKITKRTIMSYICSIFDPLGLISPIVIKAKIIIQKLWSLKLNWDESVPLDIYEEWITYKDNLPTLNKLSVPRNVINTDNIKEVQMHGFCDASQSAYGACIYVKTKNHKGIYQTQLICAKSRVAPLKTQSIPRLELSGALLLAQLMASTKQNMPINIDAIYYWCDSSITLHWIKSSSKNYQTFVANRIGQIQDLTNPDHWKHVRSGDNPADAISRGISPQELINNKLWWNGPEWLSKEEMYWPEQSILKNENLQEQKIIVTLINTVSYWNIYDKYSNLNKLIRITAYCIRFIKRKERNYSSIVVKADEYATALHYLTRNVQNHCFADEMKCLKNKLEINKTSKLISLDPFIDNSGLLRVGGRLQKSNLTFNQKHQILLPANHPLTKLIIINTHNKLFHAGPQATLYELRNTYWPLNAKNSIKQVIHKCIVCVKHKPKLIQYKLGNLPEQRVQQCRPFLNCGVDYCGPFTLKTGTIRSKITTKAYLALFVCFATKAVHVEMVTNLTSECFLNALKRFISRRGRVCNIFSDNATTFVGANKELKQLYSFIKSESNLNYIKSSLAHEKINWHFIPARSPHFGGLWEAAVKSLKFHLKRVTNSFKYTYEELLTLSVQTEAILNSRPLCPISNSPDDLSVLTPGHFLIGAPLTIIMEADVRHTRENYLSRWQIIQKQTQHIWTRWHKDYLNELQQRTKWKASNNKTTIKENDIVIIKEENLAVQRWPLGKVIETHAGSDGVIRAVTLKTKGEVVKRTTRNICKLPIDE